MFPMLLPAGLPPLVVVVFPIPVDFERQHLLYLPCSYLRFSPLLLQYRMVVSQNWLLRSCDICVSNWLSSRLSFSDHSITLSSGGCVA